jgi:hypothetical protein
MVEEYTEDGRLREIAVTNLGSMAALALLPLLVGGASGSVVQSVSPTGLPVGSAASFALAGTGLESPGGVRRCSFAPVGGGAVLTAGATTASASRVQCAVPSAASAGSYVLTLTDDGTAVRHYFDEIAVTLYDLTAVSVSRLEPPGGPVAGGTSVTLYGTGFDELGEGELCCVVDGAAECSALGTRLSSDGATGLSRVTCELGASPTGGPSSIAVSLTLNGNLAPAAPTSSSSAQFHYYEPPTFTAFSPTVGPAAGGWRVTVEGAGFENLEAQAGSAAVQAGAYARLQAGTVAGTEGPVWINDTMAVFAAPYGLAGGAQALSMALNGLDFESALVTVAATSTPAGGAGANATAQGGGADAGSASTVALGLTYEGYHSPQLVGAYLSDEMQTLKLQFDSQPTDRAAMAGLADCALLLTNASAAKLKSQLEVSAASEGGCYWESDTTLVAQLAEGSSVGPGTKVGLRVAALPLWALPLCPVPCALCPLSSALCPARSGTPAPLARTTSYCPLSPYSPRPSPPHPAHKHTKKIQPTQAIKIKFDEKTVENAVGGGWVGGWL